MSRDEFDSANNGDRVPLRDLLGRTVLFYPTEYLALEKDANGTVTGGGVLTIDYGRKDVVVTDLAVHDGRLWHRVQQSPYYGEKSRRRVMYIPVVTGKYMPKNKNSKTPFYHRFSQSVQN